MLNREHDGGVKGYNAKKVVIEVITLVENITKKNTQSQSEASTSEGELQDEVQQEPTSLPQERVKRTIKPPQWSTWDEDGVHFAFITSSGDLITFREDIKSSERGGWMGPMIDEM